MPLTYTGPIDQYQSVERVEGISLDIGHHGSTGGNDIPIVYIIMKGFARISCVSPTRLIDLSQYQRRIQSTHGLPIWVDRLPT